MLETCGPSSGDKNTGRRSGGDRSDGSDFMGHFSDGMLPTNPGHKLELIIMDDYHHNLGTQLSRPPDPSF